VGNKAHLRPHRKKRQASLTTGLLLVIVFIALVALAVAMVASGHALPAGRIFPLRRAVVLGLQGVPVAVPVEESSEVPHDWSGTWLRQR
jgi:hypothetical protein